MEEVRKFLAQGESQAAANRFVQTLKEHRDQGPQLVQQMAGILAAEYSRFVIKPVHAFVRLMAQALPAEIADMIINPIRPMLDRTAHWVDELEAVTRERLLREARAGVTTNDLRTAAQRAIAYVKRAKSPEETGPLVRQLIEALGGLARDIDRTTKLLQTLIEKNMFGPLTFDWQESLKGARARAMSSGMEESNREWTKILNGASTAIREYIPGREVGEPTPEQMSRFVHEMNALLRAGMISGNDDDLIDALMITQEYCPTDPSHIPSPVGVEPRLFLDLSPRAKLTAVRGLAVLGDQPLLRKRIVEFTDSDAAEGRDFMLCNVMGGLRHNDFFPYLKEIIGYVKTAKQQEAVVEAMSRIANPEAVGLILTELAKCVKKIIEPTEIRRAKMLLTALGRINRGRTIDPPQRNKLVSQVISLVGESDKDLSFFAAAQLFTNKPEELDYTSRVWAVRQTMAAMFSHDRGQDLKIASQSPLGFRAPMVQTLNRLGKEMLPVVLEFAEPVTGKFSGAFGAFAEAIQNIGDERAVSVLQRMIMTTFMHSPDQEKGSYLLKERVMDAASGEMREVSRNEILHGLLFALDKIGGEPGRELLLELADQVQAGQLTSPGEGASSVLFEAKRKHGSIGRLTSSSSSQAERVDPAEVDRAAKDAKGGMFSKPQKQIAALALLGRAKKSETLPSVLAALGSKDAMVFRAAETALAQFVTPPPTPNDYEQMVMALMEEQKQLKGTVLERLIEVIQRNFPKRPPYDAVFNRQVGATIDESVLAHRLKGAIQIAEDAPTALPGEGDGDNLRQGDFKHGTTRVNELDMKRQYLIARQAWIRGGKKGPAPEPPA